MGLQSVGMFQRMVNWCQGRTTAWLVAFFSLGNLFHVFHRLDATYISFMVTFMGIVLGHSIKEDYFASSGDRPQG